VSQEGVSTLGAWRHKVSAMRSLANKGSLLRGRLATRVFPPSGIGSVVHFLGAWRLAVRDTRQAVWELAAPSGTCPPPGDFTTVAWSC